MNFGEQVANASNGNSARTYFDVDSRDQVGRESQLISSSNVSSVEEKRPPRYRYLVTPRCRTQSCPSSLSFPHC